VKALWICPVIVQCCWEGQGDAVPKFLGWLTIASTIRSYTNSSWTFCSFPIAIAISIPHRRSISRSRIQSFHSGRSSVEVNILQGDASHPLQMLLIDWICQWRNISSSLTLTSTAVLLLSWFWTAFLFLSPAIPSVLWIYIHIHRPCVWRAGRDWQAPPLTIMQ